MPTKLDHTTLGITVSQEFKNRYPKPKEFWIRLGEFFAAIVGEIPITEWNKLKDEFRNEIEFFEKYIPERDGWEKDESNNILL